MSKKYKETVIKKIIHWNYKNFDGWFDIRLPFFEATNNPLSDSIGLGKKSELGPIIFEQIAFVRLEDLEKQLKEIIPLAQKFKDKVIQSMIETAK